MVTGWCIISEMEYPKILSAALFTKRMALCSSIVTMASVAVSATTRKIWAGFRNTLLDWTALVAFGFLGFDIADCSLQLLRRKLHTAADQRSVSTTSRGR